MPTSDGMGIEAGGSSKEGLARIILLIKKALGIGFDSQLQHKPVLLGFIL